MMTNRLKWGKWLLILLIAGLVLSTAYQAYASVNDLKVYPAPGRMVDVGGYRLHINCVGVGSPVVVMEAGQSGWSTDWALVQPDIAKVTRVCTYDRAGYGWSEEGAQPRDSRQVGAELHTLLTKAGIDGKIILVGHSLGGLFVQYYAKTYPQEIAGIVLVDSVHPEQSLQMKENVRKKYEGNLRALTLLTRIIAPTGLLRLANQPETIIADKLPGGYRDEVRALGFQSKAYRALDDEMANFEQSQSEVQNAGPLPKVPLAVISSTTLNNFPPGFSGDYMRNLWAELQADLAKSATMPHSIASGSGHYIHLDQSQLVIDTVVEIVNMIR